MLDIQNLFYITHINNLPSIIKQGILSHGLVEQEKINFTPIYDQQIVTNRQAKTPLGGNSLWHYANLFFQARNPMMYRLIKEKDKRDLAIIAINPSILSIEGVLVADGNAAHNMTQFYPVPQGKKILHQNWKIIQGEGWNNENGSKRQIMAECLVPHRVEPEFIHGIYVTDDQTKNKVAKLLDTARIPIIPEPNLFFQPRQLIRIGNISIIDGDMLFSNMQTLTISVNLQGVMGKGLASRTKYQFPDVYVVYQDACKSHKITATQPYLYKREASLDQELADLTLPLDSPNSVKWFLLFATKVKWRENSNIEHIAGGLNWLKYNISSMGITSLALPALGCGLGKLNWSQVGPLMCKTLYKIGIDVAIYLPREAPIDSQLLTKDYLLSD